MIAKMSKYNFVLLAAQSEDFIARLRELGLVDITTTGWEPSEEERELILDIEALQKAEETLERWQAEKEHAELKGEPYTTGVAALEAYQQTQQRAAERHTHHGVEGVLEVHLRGGRPREREVAAENEARQ